jgi:hypothetical protein
MEALRSYLPRWEHSEPGAGDEAQYRKSIYSLARTNQRAYYYM